MPEPLVYISVLNWNRAAITLSCIAQLQQQSYKNYRIIVVDNASTDDSVAQIQAAYPDILLLRSHENIGYAGGHHITVEQALSDDVELLWILNNDTEIPPDTLKYLVDAYRQHGAGLYGGVPLQMSADTDEDIVLMHYKYLNPTYREIIFDRCSFRSYTHLFPEPEKVQQVAAISGSCFLLPLSIVCQHGYMDTDYFLYSEEIDYCFRLNQIGIPSWIVPLAIIRHESEGSSTGSASILSDIVQYYRIRNQLVRIRRFGSMWDMLRIMLKNLILLASPISRGQMRRVGFMLRGMWDGLQGKLGKIFPPENYV